MVIVSHPPQSLIHPRKESETMGATGRAGTGFLGGGGGVVATNPTAQVPPSLTPTVTIQPVNEDNPEVESQAPNDQNTPVTQSAAEKVAQMTDDELAALVLASKKAKMPNFLADRDDPTQKFVFQAGINERPVVLDSADFNKYLTDNNIDPNTIIARSVNGATYKNQQGYNVTYSAQQVQDMLKHSKLTYIGGKHGGQAYGAGAYFAMTGNNGGTGYGANTAVAVIDTSKARIIDEDTLSRRALRFAQTHPKFANAVGKYSSNQGGNASIYALAMGYNVITDHSPNANGGYIRTTNRGGATGDYYNVIDRRVLVYKK